MAMRLQPEPALASMRFEPLGFLPNFRNIARVPPVIRVRARCDFARRRWDQTLTKRGEAEL
jgi:hypothetical protein